MIVRTKKPIKNIRKSEDIVTEKTARISKQTMTVITKNISAILDKKSRIKVGFSIPYINLSPLRSAEIPRDAAQDKEIAEKERKLPEILKKTSSKIVFAASKETSGKNDRKTFIISYSETDTKSLTSEINKVANGMEEIRI